MSLHWRCLFAPCNSHLNSWSLFLSLFCIWSYLLKESILFVSFCAFVLVFAEFGDKYHPYSSVRVLLSVVSCTTHTRWHDLFVLLCTKSPFLLHMFSTRFPLLLSASFYCCACSRITYNTVHRTTSTMSSWEICFNPLNILSPPSANFGYNFFFFFLAVEGGEWFI